MNKGKSTATIFYLLVSMWPGAALVYGQSDTDAIEFGNYRILNSEILGENRMLYVHLPQDYETSDSSYPVIFQLYSHFTYNYYLPAISASIWMQRHGEAPGTIVVGVKNLEFRYRDLLPVDHNQTKSQIDNFLRFFEEELVAFIDQNYRTNGYRILAGPQAGAAFGIYSLARNPELFDAFFLTSPFWIPDAREPLINLIDSASRTNSFDRKFLMITYKDRLANREREYLDTLSRILVKNNSSLEFVLNPLDAGAHFTSPVGFMHGLKTLFKSYKFPGVDTPQELQAIENYYTDLSGQYGFEIQIPEHGLVFEGDKFIARREWEMARPIFLKVLELYPKSDMALDRLGTIAFRRGEFELAREYYQQFLEITPEDPYALSWLRRIEKALNE